MKKSLKKLLSLALIGTFALGSFTGCGKKEEENKTIKIAASATPHAEILEYAKDKLKEKGYVMAIVSNKIDSAVKVLDQEYFGGYTAAAIGEMEGVARKPAPDTVEKALKEIGVAKENAIYVGDSDVDVETAKNAGLPCVSVLWGFRDKEFLLEHGADIFINQPQELLNLL